MKTDSILSQIEQAVFAQQNVELTAALVASDPVLTATGKLLWPIPTRPSPAVSARTIRLEAATPGSAHFHTGIDLWVPLGRRYRGGRRAWCSPTNDRRRRGAVGYGNYVIVPARRRLKSLYGHLLADQRQGGPAGQAWPAGRPGRFVGQTSRSTHPLRGADR